ncbi:MAG: translocation/assembly module TamB domain-containing protein [Polyangiales bacterium]
MQCDVTLDIDRTGTRIDAQRCLARARLISRIAGVPINADATITHVRLSRPPMQPLRIELDARVADSPVNATLQLDGSVLEASLNTRGLDLSRVRPDLPQSDISGRVRFRRDAATMSLDATELDARVAGIAIPPARARARLRTPETLELEDVEVPSMRTHARGTVSLAQATSGDAELDVEGDLRDANEIELLRSIGLAGSARYRAHVSRRGGETNVSFEAHGRNLRVPGGVRIARGRANGSIALARDGAMHLRADADGSGLVASGFGPLDASVHVEGDPRRALRGRFHGNGDHITALPGDAARGPTRADGSFEIHRDEQQTRVSLGRTRVTVRGARATVTASVRAPARGRPTVHATIETDDGGRAAIDVGPDGIRTDLGQLPTEWIARALGQERGVGGTIAGDLRLAGGRPRGRLHWRGGSLPVLGAVELDVDATAHEGLDRVVADLRYGTAPQSAPNDRPRISVEALFDARRASRGGADGAVQSVHSVRAQIERVPASLLQQFAPPGVSLAGTANATVTATRDAPNAPLSTVLGFDLRGFVASASVRAAITGAIFGRRREPRVNTRGASALTIPLRLRGAVCATVANARSVPERAQSAIAWGADSSDPVIPVPTQCVLREADFTRALVRAEGTVGGPWHAAMTGAISTIRSSRGSGKRWADVVFERETMQALAAATVALDLHVGPASPAQWPFTPAAARLMPALVRPPVNGTLDSSIHIDGPLRAPSIVAELHATSDAPEWLNPNDQARVDARINITSTHEAATVLDRALVDVDARASLVRQRGSLEDSATRAALELRSRVQPRALFDGRAGLRSITIERASVRSNSLDLSRLAWARTNRVEGRASLSLTDTGDAGRPFLLNVNVNDLRVRSQPPANVALRAGLYDGCAVLTQRTDACRARDWALRSCLSWTPGTQGSAGCDPVARNEYTATNGLRVLASVPLNGDWHEADVRVNEAQIIVSAVSFPLEGIAPLAERPPIMHLGGNLNGSLRWRASDPRALAGYMGIQRGELTIERMGVPIRDIELNTIAAGRQIRFTPPMTMHLGSGGTQGSLSATGVIDLNGRNGELAHIRINPTVESFPAVQEGNLYAIITGALTFDADLFRDRMSGSLIIRRANVTVPEDSSRSLQSLDEAPGVFVLGRSRVSAPTVSRSFTTDLSFRTEEPIFLRRRDFLIGVTTEGSLRYDNAIYLRGAVSQFGRQNFFELFGKRFYFDRVSVLFDGGSSIDPLLDVALHYDSPTDGRISITVTGRKNSPEIRFSAERYPGASDAEILAMLVLGRRESRGASDQATLEQQGRQAAASLLTAVLYGFGAGQVQRALESTGMGFVPTVIAEPGADGTALSRLGIGVLPSFLGNRVYIEGTYNNTQATGQGAQLLIDATINDHFSVGGVLGTSTNNGQRFGLDFFFTP